MIRIARLTLALSTAAALLSGCAGMITGGPLIRPGEPTGVISVVNQKNGLDEDLLQYETVWAAAGLPTAVFEVPPATLRTLANATVARIRCRWPTVRPIPMGTRGSVEPRRS